MYACTLRAVHVRKPIKRLWYAPSHFVLLVVFAFIPPTEQDCMDRNGYNREECLDFFQVYRDCKKTWVSIDKVYADGSTNEGFTNR